MKVAKQVVIKLFLVGVFVPLIVSALNMLMTKWFNSPIISLVNFTLGLILSYMILTFYERIFIRKESKLASIVKDNQEELQKVRFEVAEIIEVLDHNQMGDANELALLASIKKDMEIKKESGNTDRLL